MSYIIMSVLKIVAVLFFPPIHVPIFSVQKWNKYKHLVMILNVSDF